jgi:Ca2+ transporting ATPase
MCKSKKETVEIDPSIALKYGIKLSDLREVMELKSQEATEKIKQNFGGFEGLAQKLNVNIITGLSGDPQDIHERQAVFGKNVLPPKEPKLFIQLVFEALQDATLILLIICAVVTIGLSFYHPADDATTEEAAVVKTECMF